MLAADDFSAFAEGLCARRRITLMDHLREVDPGPHLDWWHIGAMVEASQAVLDGEIERLFINAPPRTWKSRTVVVGSTSCRIRNEPRSKIMLACAASDLVFYHSRHARDMAEGAGVALKRDSRAVDLWETEEHGTYKAITVQAGRFGFGWDFGVWDDPFTSMQMALSPLVQRRTWEIFRDEFRTRAQDRPEGGPPGLILMHQRLARGDVVGRLIEHLEDTGEERWHALILEGYKTPANFVLPSCVTRIEDPRKAGEPLCDDPGVMREIDRRRRSSPRLSRAVDGQDPPEDVSGGHFLASWFHRLGDGRDDLDRPTEALVAMAKSGEIASPERWIRGHDFSAGGEDATASIELCVLRDNPGIRYIWFDPTEGHPPVGTVKPTVLNNADRDRQAEQAIPREAAMGRVVTADIHKGMRAAGFRVHEIPVGRGKIALATPHASLAAPICRLCQRVIVAEDELDLMPSADVCSCEAPDIRPGKVAVLAGPGADRIVQVLHAFTGLEGGDDHLVDAMSHAVAAAGAGSAVVHFELDHWR